MGLRPETGGLEDGGMEGSADDWQKMSVTTPQLLTDAQWAGVRDCMIRERARSQGKEDIFRELCHLSQIRPRHGSQLQPIVLRVQLNNHLLTHHPDVQDLKRSFLPMFASSFPPPVIILKSQGLVRVTPFFHMLVLYRRICTTFWAAAPLGPEPGSDISETQDHPLHVDYSLMCCV